MEKDQLTSEVQSRCFKLLDEYARAKHNCFVTEFFLSTLQSDSFTVCFRPLDGTINDSNRYACKYLQFGISEVHEMASSNPLPIHVLVRLDEALSTLSQS